MINHLECGPVFRQPVKILMTFPYLFTLFLLSFLTSCVTNVPNRSYDPAFSVDKSINCPKITPLSFSKRTSAKVVRVMDGDTVLLSSGRKVRLVGVDTPETVHPNRQVEHFGPEASYFTKKNLEGEVVEVVVDQKSSNSSHLDRHGRLLAYVFRKTDGMDFNAELIKQGFAFAYTKFPFEREEEFRCLEEAARNSQSGLWGDPPIGSDTAHRPIRNEISSANCPIIGNTETLIFHSRNDKHYRRMLRLNADGVDNRRCFKSRSHAKSAGYRACRRP